jgi:hypothetical protein
MVAVRAVRVGRWMRMAARRMVRLLAEKANSHTAAWQWRSLYIADVIEFDFTTLLIGGTSVFVKVVGKFVVI